MSTASGERRRSLPCYPDLAGKIAVITGGSRGIGAASARMLAANDVKLALNGRTAPPLDRLVTELRADGATAVAFQGDCTREADMAAFSAFVESELGPPDILVAFAGGFEGFTSIENVTEREWRDVLDANLTSTFLTVKAFLPPFVNRGNGVIVTMASNGGRYLDKLLT